MAQIPKESYTLPKSSHQIQTNDSEQKSLINLTLDQNHNGGTVDIIKSKVANVVLPSAVKKLTGFDLKSIKSVLSDDFGFLINKANDSKWLRFKLGKNYNLLSTAGAIGFAYKIYERFVKIKAKESMWLAERFARFFKASLQQHNKLQLQTYINGFLQYRLKNIDAIKNKIEYNILEKLKINTKSSNIEIINSNKELIDEKEKTIDKNDISSKSLFRKEGVKNSYKNKIYKDNVDKELVENFSYNDDIYKFLTSCNLSKVIVRLEVPDENSKYIPQPPYTFSSAYDIEEFYRNRDTTIEGINPEVMKNQFAILKSIEKFSDISFNFNGYIPLSGSLNYQIESPQLETLSISGGLNIGIPVAKIPIPSLSFEVFNNEYNNIYNYKVAYKNSMMLGYRTVLPYKNAVTIINIYVLSRQLDVLHQFRLLGILETGDISLNTSSKDVPFDELKFSIVGYLKEGEKFSL